MRSTSEVQNQRLNLEITNNKSTGSNDKKETNQFHRARRIPGVYIGHGVGSGIFEAESADRVLSPRQKEIKDHISRLVDLDMVLSIVT